MNQQVGVRFLGNRATKEWLRQSLETVPWLYLELLRLSRAGHKSQQRIVSRTSDLVIDGYPRSANSFAYVALRDSQPGDKPLNIATHIHSPAQIIQAVRWNIPAMVMLRDPRSAFRGILAHRLQHRIIPAVTEKEVQRVAGRYIRFYESLPAYRDGFFLARFDDVTSDYATVSQRFIERFGRTWQPYDPVALPPERIFQMKVHIGPDLDREKIKKEVEANLDRWLDPGLYARAMAIYERLGRD